MVYGPKEVKRETARPPDARVVLGWRPGELFPFPFFLPKGMGWGPGTFSFILFPSKGEGPGDFILYPSGGDGLFSGWLGGLCASAVN